MTLTIIILIVVFGLLAEALHIYEVIDPHPKTAREYWLAMLFEKDHFVITIECFLRGQRKRAWKHLTGTCKWDCEPCYVEGCRYLNRSKGLPANHGFARKPWL